MLHNAGEGAVRTNEEYEASVWCYTPRLDLN